MADERPPGRINPAFSLDPVVGAEFPGTGTDAHNPTRPWRQKEAGTDNALI